MSKIKKNNKAKNNKGYKAIILVILCILVSLALGVSGVGGYLYTVERLNPAAKRFYKKVSLPIVRIENGENISSKQLFQDVVAVRKFYESEAYNQKGIRVDFSTKEGEVRLLLKERDILNKLIEDRIIKSIAETKGLQISTQDIDDAVEKSLIEADSDYEKLRVNLKSNYGWTIEEFKNKIVRNQLYLDKLFQWYKGNLKKSAEYQRAQRIKDSISNTEGNFNELVKQFSEGEGAKQSKSIPWIKEGDIIPEVAEALKSMKEGQVSNVIVSPLGIHIVKLENRREVTDEKDNIKNEIQLKQIFLHNQSFIDWIQEQKKEAKIKVLLREYQWNTKMGELEFSSSDLSETIEQIKIKSQGDPSIQ